MLKPLRFDISELHGMKLPVRLINATNERRLVQEHETPLRVKGDIKDVSSKLGNGGQRLHFWVKCPGFYCSQRVMSLIKSVQDLYPP
ncbi:hypothetical protein TNCV_2706431 [Trichonephila clavipes]|nr:hypothetical protein TNCV_2706431 [Trichonephila clavipes]